jgi:hypothetical protein
MYLNDRGTYIVTTSHRGEVLGSSLQVTFHDNVSPSKERETEQIGNTPRGSWLFYGALLAADV